MSVSNEVPTRPSLRHLQIAKREFLAGKTPYLLEATERVNEVRIQDVLIDRSGLGAPRKLRPSNFSAANSFCSRFHAFRYFQFPEPEWEERNLEAVHQGTVIHEDWQRITLATGLISAIEVPVKLGAMKGNADGVFANEPVMLEIKSANDRNWTYATQKGPKWGYIAAAHCYMKGLKRHTVHFAYINSEDYRKVHEERVEWDTRVWKTVSAVLTQADAAVRAGDLPPIREGCRAAAFNRADVEKHDQLIYKRCPFADICMVAQAPKE